MIINMPKKLILDVDNETWKRVQKYKIDHELKNSNIAVIKLVMLGLKSEGEESR